MLEEKDKKEKIKERGLFICFEGLEGTGKTTFLKMLEEYFKSNNQSTMSLSFPCNMFVIKVKRPWRK